MGRNVPLTLGAEPTHRVFNAAVIQRPYITVTRSSGGNVNSGSTTTFYLRIYNPNKYNMTGARVRFEVTGSGFSGAVGTVNQGSGTYATGVTITNVSAATTSNWSSISYKEYTCHYKAPSTTTQGTATINAFFESGGTIDGVTGITGASASLSITVNASVQPSAYYYPFRAYDSNGLQINNINFFAGGDIQLCTNNDCVNGVHGDPEYSDVTLSGITNGNEKIFYLCVMTGVSTSYFDEMRIYNVPDAGSADMLEAYAAGLSRASVNTYAALNSAGIVDMYFYYAGTVVGCDSPVKFYSSDGINLMICGGDVATDYAISTITIRVNHPSNNTVSVHVYANDGFDNYLPSLGSSYVPLSNLYSSATDTIIYLVATFSNGTTCDFMGASPQYMFGVDGSVMGGDFFNEAIGDIRWLNGINWTECMEVIEEPVAD